jgi:hypothetical protein
MPGFVLTLAVWPAPTSGLVTIACAWPAGGLAEAHLTLDGWDFTRSE